MYFVKTRAFTLGFTLSLVLGFGAHADQASPLSNFIGDSAFTQNIFDLSTSAGLQGAPAVQPWSGSYWPLHSGSIANPYFMKGNAWLNYRVRMLIGVKANERHYEKRIADIRNKIDTLDNDTINQMAPSEK